MARDYLLLFAQILQTFRLEELQAVSELLDVKISFDATNVDVSTPFLRVALESEEDARKLGSRCILLRGIYEFWAHEPTYDAVFRTMQEDPSTRALWTPYISDTSFKFSVSACNATLAGPEARRIIDSFSWMGYKGRIQMENPELEVCVWEDWPEPRTGDPTYKRERKGIWIGKKICDGQRELVDLFDLKKRVYIGNTSMAADMSLLMANQAKAAPGKLFYDPFVGTGSMLYTSAYFGATVMGSDIDGRHIRGKMGKSVFDSASQYGVRERILDCLVFDLTQNPFRVGGILDAIVTDPPYGVRAGAKRLGRKDESKLRMEPYVLADGSYSHEAADWVPPSKPWEMSEVLVELLRQALYLLKPGGRLVYWLPTITDEYKASDVPQLKGLKLVANSEQDFGKWARRLITMEKVPEGDVEDTDASNGSNAVPAHFDFRKAYFNKFLPLKDVPNGKDATG